MPLRVLAPLLLATVLGCSAQEVNSPLDFFPGSQPTSWAVCDKFGAAGDHVQVCASLVNAPGTQTAISYSISFFLPRTLHVRLAAFDAHGALVKVLLDGEESATIGQYRTPPIIWDFTDSRGARVPRGNYRCYIAAGPDFVSSSDVAVP